LVAIGGILLAYSVYVKRAIDYEKAYEALKALHTTFKEQFFTERLYHNIIAASYLMYSKTLYVTFERLFIDGIVNSTYKITEGLGNLLKLLQAGKINWYVAWISIGLTLVVLTITLITIKGGF